MDNTLLSISISSWIRSTQRATCCQWASSVNICEEELPLLAAADASCVDSWIGPSPRSAGQQCYAARQRLQRELTVISSKYHFAAMQAAPCQHLGSSMHRGQREKKNIGSSQRQLLTLARSTSGEVCEYFFFPASSALHLDVWCICNAEWRREVWLGFVIT